MADPPAYAKGAGYGNKTSGNSNLSKADSGGGYSSGNTSSTYGSGTTGGAGESFIFSRECRTPNTDQASAIRFPALVAIPATHTEARDVIQATRMGARDVKRATRMEAVAVQVV